MKFDLKLFLEGKVKVHCLNECDAKNFFEYLLKHDENASWVTSRPLDKNNTRWNENKEHTIYVYEPWSYGLAYGSDEGKDNPWIKYHYTWDSEREEKKVMEKTVVQISIDIIMTEEQRNGDYQEEIAKILEDAGYIVAGTSFSGDLTDVYKKDYPEYLK